MYVLPLAGEGADRGMIPLEVVALFSRLATFLGEL